jgi:hypothetical protein
MVVELHLFEFIVEPRGPSLLFVADAPPSIPGTFDEMKKAISSANFTPMRPSALSKDVVKPYSTVYNMRHGIRNNIYASSTFMDYYDLGTNLAIAEGQAYLAGVVGVYQSWQYACWALDSALYAANALANRVQIDRNALSALRNNVCYNHPSNASSSIKTLREQYAYAVHTTAEPAVCGNGVCDAGETSGSCAIDCGSASGPCPNNPGGQPNTYQFCIACASNWVYTRTETGCTYTAAFNWVQGTTSSNCWIYANACP